LLTTGGEWYGNTVNSCGGKLVLAKEGEGGWGKNSFNKGGGEEGEGKEKRFNHLKKGLASWWRHILAA